MRPHFGLGHRPGAPGKRPCAYFCVLPDTDTAFNFLASLFYSFLFIKLTRLADRRGGPCPVPVNFILDEFCNVPPVRDFEKKISTVRGRGIGVTTVFKNIPQLTQNYGNQLWEVILGNCDYWLVLGTKERATAAYVADILGHTSVRKVTDQRPKGLREWLDPWDGRELESVERAPLMDLSVVARLSPGECLVRVADGRIVKLKKHIYTQHPLCGELEPVHVLEYRPARAEAWREGSEQAEAKKVGRGTFQVSCPAARRRVERAGRGFSSRSGRDRGLAGGGLLGGGEAPAGRLPGLFASGVVSSASGSAETPGGRRHFFGVLTGAGEPWYCKGNGVPGLPANGRLRVRIVVAGNGVSSV